MGEAERGHIEVYQKLWNLRTYDKTKGEMTRNPRVLPAYQGMKKETEDWDDFKKLPEEISQFPPIRALLLGKVVYNPRLRAYETNERKMAEVSRKNWLAPTNMRGKIYLQEVALIVAEV